MPRKAKGFSRVDSGDAHGWLVRIKRGDTRRSRFISDSTHGGKAKAKKVAREVYEEWVAELPPPDTAQDKLGKRNSSGVVGVHFAHDTDARYPDLTYDYYVASWKTEDGRRRNVRFAVSKHGKRAAFELACIAREHRLADREAVLALYEKAKGKPRKKATKKKAAKKAATKSAAAKPKKKAKAAKRSPTKAAKRGAPSKKKTSTKKGRSRSK